MPFYFIAGFKKPAASNDTPKLVVIYKDKEYPVEHGIFQFIPPSINSVNYDLTRLAESGYQIEFTEEYNVKTVENIKVAKRVMSQVDLTQIQRDQGRKVALNAELPELRVGMIAAFQQKQLDARHKLLEPFIKEGVKLQKTAIWRRRLSDILAGKQDAQKDKFMKLFSEVWGDTASKIILMNEVCNYFKLKERVPANELATNFNLAFANIKFLPPEYQDQIAEYILTELITKITALAISNTNDAQTLLDDTKKHVPEHPERLRQVITQFAEIIAAHKDLTSYSGGEEESLKNKLETFCDKATCFTRAHAAGQTTTIKAELLTHLAQSSSALFEHVQRRKFGSNLVTTLQQSKNRLDLSKYAYTDQFITSLSNHYIAVLAQNISDPIKTAQFLAAAEKRFQDVINNLVEQKNQRRRQGGDNIAQEINRIDSIIEKATLAKDAVRDVQFLSEFINVEERIDDTGFSPDKSLILFARYIHTPTDLLDKSKHLVAALAWCNNTLAEVNATVKDEQYKKIAIADLERKKSEIIRAQQALAYEMLLIIKNIRDTGKVNTVDMAQNIFRDAEEQKLIDREAFRYVLPKTYPMGECLMTQFIDYIDKHGNLSVRNQLHHLKFFDDQALMANPTIPLISHGRLRVPAIIVGDKLNIHFTPEGMTPKEKPWFFQINSKARYKLFEQSSFSQFNVLMAEINMVMKIANTQSNALGEANQYMVLQWIEKAKAMLQQERQRLNSSWTGGGDFDANYHKVISYAENQLYYTAYELARTISGRLDVTFFQENDFLMSKESLETYNNFVSTYGKKAIKVNDIGRPIETNEEFADYSKTFAAKTKFLQSFLTKLDEKYYLTIENQVLAIKKHGDTDVYEIQHDADLCEKYHIASGKDKKLVAEQTKHEVNAIRLIATIITGIPTLADFNKDRDDLEKLKKLPEDIISIISKLPGYNKAAAENLLATITKRYISTRSLTDLTNDQVQVMQYFDLPMWKKHNSAMVISHRHMMDVLEFLDQKQTQETIDKCNSQEMQDCFLTSRRSDSEDIVEEQEKKIVLLDKEIAPQIIRNATRLLSYQDALRNYFERGQTGKIGEKPLPGLTDIIGKIFDHNDKRLVHLERIILNVDPPSNTALSTYRIKLLDLYFAKSGVNRANRDEMPDDRKSLIDTIPCHFNEEQVNAIRAKIEDKKIVSDPSLLILVRDIIRREKNEALKNELLRRLQFSVIRYYLKIDANQENADQQALTAKRKVLDAALKDINVERFYTPHEEQEFVELLRLKEIPVGDKPLALDEISRVSYQSTLDVIYDYLPPIAKKAAVHTLSIKLIETGKALDDTKKSAADGTYVDGNLEFIRKILADSAKGNYFDAKQYEMLFNALKAYLIKAEFKIWPLLQLFIDLGGKPLAATYGLNLVRRIIFEQVGLRNQVKENEEPTTKDKKQPVEVVVPQPAELLRESSLDNRVLYSIVNNYFDNDQKILLQSLAEEYAYTRDNYVRNLLVDILKEGDSNYITSQLQKNEKDLVRVSKSIKEAIDWLHKHEVTADTQVKLSTFIGSGIVVVDSSTVEYQDRDVMIQGFLNEIVAKFSATQPDPGASANERKDDITKALYQLATNTLLSQTIPLMKRVYTQIKRDLPWHFTPKGFQEVLAAIPEHDKVTRAQKIAEYDAFQNQHHFELNFLRYLCRYLNSVDHAHVISFMNTKDTVNYLTDIKFIFDELEKEKQQLAVPPLPQLSAKATAAERQTHAEQHKKDVQTFYADQGYLAVMSPAAIDKRLQQAVAKQIKEQCAPAETAAKVQTDDQVKAAVVELLPMTDSKAVSTEFRNLIEQGWFARPIMQESNWLTSTKGELFRSADAASAYLVEKLSEPDIQPESYSMLSQAVVDWLYSMAKQSAMDPSPLTAAKKAEYDAFINEYLPNVDIIRISRRDLITRILKAGPEPYQSLYVLLHKINDIGNANISLQRDKVELLANVLQETVNILITNTSRARSTALQLYSVMSASDVPLIGKEQLLTDISDYTKRLLEDNEFERARDFVVLFNRDDNTRKIVFRNYQDKLNKMLTSDHVNYNDYERNLAAIFAPTTDMEKSVEKNKKIAEMLKKHHELQFDLALHVLARIENRLRRHIHSGNMDAVKNEIQLLLFTYCYLARSNKKTNEEATNIINNILSNLLMKGLGDTAIAGINQFITSAIASNRHNMAIDAIYSLGRHINEQKKQIEQNIANEENRINTIKTKIENEQYKYQTFADYDVSDKNLNNVAAGFLIDSWQYEDQLISEAAARDYHTTEESKKGEAARNQQEYVKQRSHEKNEKEVTPAGFILENGNYRSIDIRGLTPDHLETRKQSVNNKLLRIALMFRAVDQLLIDVYTNAIKDLSSSNPDVKQEAVSRLNVVSHLIEQMPHKPQYLVDIKAQCESLVSQNPQIDKIKLSELSIKHKSYLEQNIKLITGDDDQALPRLYELWQKKAAGIAGDLNAKLNDLMQVKGNIQHLHNDLAESEKRLAVQKAILQRPLEYQSGVQSFLFMMKNVAAAISNKVIAMVNWFWSASNHKDNVKREVTATTASTSLRSHLQSLLDTDDKANYLLIIKTYENPNLDINIKQGIRDIYENAIRKSPEYINSLDEAFEKSLQDKNWATLVPIAFKLIDIKPTDASYCERIKQQLATGFAVRGEKESDNVYAQRVIEGIKLLAELYRSPEYLKNDAQIIALREFAANQFVALLKKCDAYKQPIGPKLVVNQVDLAILAKSVQSLSLILPVMKDKGASTIFNLLNEKAESNLAKLLKNQATVPVAIQFLYGVCPPASGIAAKSIWSTHLSDEQISAARNQNTYLFSRVLDLLPSNSQTLAPGFKQSMIDYFGAEKAQLILNKQSLDANEQREKIELENMVEHLDMAYINGLITVYGFDFDNADHEVNIYLALENGIKTYLTNEQQKKFLANLENKLMQEPQKAEQLYAQFEPAVKICLASIASGNDEYKNIKVFYYLGTLLEYREKLKTNQTLTKAEKAYFEICYKYVFNNGGVKQKELAQQVMNYKAKLEQKAVEASEQPILARMTFGWFGGSQKASPATSVAATPVHTPPATPRVLRSTAKGVGTSISVTGAATTPVRPSQPSVVPPAATVSGTQVAAPAAVPVRPSQSAVVPPAAAASSTQVATTPVLPVQPLASISPSARVTPGTARQLGTFGTFTNDQPPQPPVPVESKPKLINLPEDTGDVLPAIPNGLCGYNSIALQIGLAALQFLNEPNNQQLSEMLRTTYNELKKVSRGAILGERSFEDFCKKLAIFMADEPGRNILQTRMAPHLFTLAHSNIDERERKHFLDFAKQEMMESFEVFANSITERPYEKAVEQLINELGQGELREILDKTFFDTFTIQLEDVIAKTKNPDGVFTPGHFGTAVSNAQLIIGEYFDSIANNYWAKRDNNKWLGQYEIDKLGKKLGFGAEICRQKESKWETSTNVGAVGTGVSFKVGRRGLHYDVLLAEHHRKLIAAPTPKQRYS